MKLSKFGFKDLPVFSGSANSSNPHLHQDFFCVKTEKRSYTDCYHFLAENVSRCMKSFYTDCYHFLAENVSRCMNNFFTPLIRESIHYDAKLSSDEENWNLRTRKKLLSI